MADDKQSQVKALRHDEAKRTNIPTAEDGSLLSDEEAGPKPVGYVRRNSSREHPEDYARDEDRDPQLVWKGKDAEDETDLVVGAPPIYIQEKISARVLVENLLRFFRRLKVRGPRAAGEDQPLDYPDEHDEIPDPEARVEFYQHGQRWTNRMILGDSLQVMASLAERENMSGKVQCIFMDPPYGINYHSNWQTSTRSTVVADKEPHQEPEVVRAFRDTWKKGVHSYLSYLRDRLQAAHELLTETGSIFLQIGDENVHLCRSLLDEVFGRGNYITTIKFRKSTPLGQKFLSDSYDYILWFAKDRESARYNPLYFLKEKGGFGGGNYTRVQLSDGTVVPEKAVAAGRGRLCSLDGLVSPGRTRPSIFPFTHNGVTYPEPQKDCWKSNFQGLTRLQKAGRLFGTGSPQAPRALSYVRLFDDTPVVRMESTWTDTSASFMRGKIYPVQTKPSVIERCILMTTQPGDLVLDPTCGSGTTAHVAEQWGRRWITIDTSKVALAGARARLMGARFPYYILADSEKGAKEEERLSGTLPPGPYNKRLSRGFVYERKARVTLGQITNNAEVDEIWEKHQKVLVPLLAELNRLFGENWKEWEVPIDPPPGQSAEQRNAHEAYWRERFSRQEATDKSIARASENVFFYDRPVEDKKLVRVSGPFTVEALSPHRIVPVDEEDLEAEAAAAARSDSANGAEAPFHEIVRDWLEQEGVAGATKDERLVVQSLQPLQHGRHVHFVGKCGSNGEERDVAVLVGDEFGTITREQIARAAREAGQFCDYLLVLGFAFDGYAAGDDIGELGRVRYRRVRMDQELRMVERLAKGKKHTGNLFTFIGEVDVKFHDKGDDEWAVEVQGVEVYDFNRHEMRSAEANEIACWFIDTDYNEESFFVRHAYFPGRRDGDVDPYESLKKALRGEIALSEWEPLNRTVSRPFKRPEKGLIAVKAINDRGDEVLKVCEVPPRGASGG